MSGNTKYAADMIAEATGADTLRIAPVKAYPDKGAKKFLWGGKSAVMGDKPPLQPYSFNADEYDTVIFGTPVWASNITPPLRTFVTENMDKLAGKKIAVFTCYSGGGAEKAHLKLKNLLGITDFTAELILTDPKDKPDTQNGVKINEFCEKLK